MVELIAILSSALVALGGFLFGRFQFKRGQRDGARVERKRTQLVTKAMARQVEAADSFIQKGIEQAQERQASDLRHALDVGPSEAQVQDLIDDAESLAPTKDLKSDHLTEGLE